MKSLRLTLVTIMIIIPITISSCTPATATPTGTVNAYLDAIVAQNPQTIITYETEDNYYGMTHAERIGYWENSFESIKSYSLTNRDLVVDSETETIATVSVSFDLSTTYSDDSTNDQTTTLTYELTKVDGKWLISNGI